MSKAHTVIHGLDQLKQAEYKTAEYYNGAAAAASKQGLADHAIVYQTIKQAHDALALRLEGRKQELEKEVGEGLVEELVENVVDALKAFVADLPTLFFQKETDASPAVLLSLEQELLGQYQNLHKHADDTTRQILDLAIEASKNHANDLEAMHG